MEKEILKAMKKAGKPLRTGDIAKMLDKENKEVSKAMNELKKKGKIPLAIWTRLSSEYQVSHE